MKRPVIRCFVLLVVLVAVFLAVWRAVRPDAAAYTKTHYAKYEYRIPMRDGVKLFTQVYVPKDNSQSYPFLINRTPYGVAPYGQDAFRARLGPAHPFDRSGYIFVFQDVRGRNESEGEFVEVRPVSDSPRPGEVDESTDTYDTIEWLLKNVKSNNGKVGIWGISYPGFYASAAIINSHPAIKAASPEAPVTNLFEGDDSYHNGAFMLSALFEFYATFFRPRPDGPEVPGVFHPFDFGTDDGTKYFLDRGPALPDLAAVVKNPMFDDQYQHNTLDDYWKARDVSEHLKNVQCAVLTVGGWFDAEDLAGTLRTYHAIESSNPGTFNVLVMGPWAHGGWSRSDGKSLGPISFGAATADFYREHIVSPFFEHYLKNQPAAELPEASVFETGTNTWKQYDAWPPKNAQQKTIYLHANGKLSFDPPTAGEGAYDEYVSDPAKPVPLTASPGTGAPPQEYMVADQRFAEKRPDVRTYVSDPLPTDITLAGPVSPHLVISSSGTDSDFDVKLIDVYPADAPNNMAGYEQLLRGEPMRAKFRNSLSQPEPLVPNQPTPLNFAMPDVNHTFLKGHRIMVQVQSSWFPLTDLNPQQFINTAQAKRSDFVQATERVYHTPERASEIIVEVLPQQ
jgi:putative CocE/NonD family hydrolase